MSNRMLNPRVQMRGLLDDISHLQVDDGAVTEGQSRALWGGNGRSFRYTMNTNYERTGVLHQNFYVHRHHEDSAIMDCLRHGWDI